MRLSSFELPLGGLTGRWLLGYYYYIRNFDGSVLSLRLVATLAQPYAENPAASWDQEFFLITTVL